MAHGLEDHPLGLDDLPDSMGINQGDHEVTMGAERMATTQPVEIPSIGGNSGRVTPCRWPVPKWPRGAISMLLLDPRGVELGEGGEAGSEPQCGFGDRRGCEVPLDL